MSKSTQKSFGESSPPQHANVESIDPQDGKDSKVTKGNRGRTNHRGRGRATRISRGLQSVRNNSIKFDVGLFKLHGGIKQFTINNINYLIQSQRAIELPLTTRGIGILIQECANTLLRAHPNIEVPAISMYRVALAMAECKAIYSRSQCPLTTSGNKANIYPNDCNIYNLMCNGVIRHLRPIVNLVDSIGTFRINDMTYCPYIDEGSIKLSNLRDYVVVTSNVVSAVDLRTRAYELNSIPTANFDHEIGNDNAVLQDPDTIMPDNYNYINLVDDMKRIDSYFRHMGRNVHNLDATWKMTEIGLPSQLVSCKSAISIRAVELAVPCEGDSTFWWSPHPLTTSEYISGVVHLLGECVTDSGTGYRQATFGCSKLELSWRDTVLAMLAV